MSSRSPWVPHQHGAWAMLAVPLLVGVLLRVHAGVPLPVHLAPLALFWFAGYFTFAAMSLWLKAAPARRPALLPPVLTYAAASTVFGVLTLVLAGPGVLGWVPFYLMLLVPALVLAAQRRERATLGGALTTAAASLMTLVVTHPDPAALLHWTPYDRGAAVAAGLVFAYFFGTVWYVKTNIRERGSRRYYAVSVAWHAATALVAVALAGAGAASGWWVVLFALATVRAAVVPRLPGVTPLKIGLLEIGFSTAILLIAAFA